MEAIITVGISASGKTSWAEPFCRKNGYLNINRDNMRFSLFGATDWSNYKFDSHKEGIVTNVNDALLVQAHHQGRNVVISDTNLNKKYRESLQKRLTGLGFKWQIKEFDVPYNTALKRDSRRNNGVGQEVLYRQWKQWLEFKKSRRYEGNSDLPKAIICDIDGTIAQMVDRKPYDWDRVGEDTLNEHVLHMVNGFKAAGHKIIFMSGRDSVCRIATAQWLNRHNVPYDDLFMRAEGDVRPDTEIKAELFWPLTSVYNISAVIDDRNCMVDMWNDLGLNVIAVGDNREIF
jgi:predicted kinase